MQRSTARFLQPRSERFSILVRIIEKNDPRVAHPPEKYTIITVTVINAIAIFIISIIIIIIPKCNVGYFNEK